MSPDRITIDQRPIALVLLSKSYRYLFLALLFGGFLYFINSDPWEDLSPKAYKAIWAFLLCSTLWFTQAIPLAITGLLAIAIIPILGILPSREVFSYFGNEAVFFIMGAFILSAAIMKSGLSTRLSLLFLNKKSMSPKGLIFTILFSTAILSCFMSEHAVAAFFFPIVLEIARSLDFEPEGGEYGKTLFLAMAWGCVIGGIVTFLGGARAPLAVGMLQEITGHTIGFFEWMKITVFVAVPLFVFAYFLLTRYFKIDVESVENARLAVVKRNKSIGLISGTEVMVGLILLGAIVSWVWMGESKGLANISIIAVVLLFVFRLVNWKDMEEYVNWGIILMYGGAIALGRAVDSSGALEWLSVKVVVFPQHLAVWLGGDPGFWLVAVLSLAAIFLTELFSNAAVVALLLPISMKMAVAFHMSPAIMAYAIAIPCGLGFIMPMGTPAVAIAYSSGYLKVKDLALPGLLMNLAGWVFFVVTAYFFWPWFQVAF